MVILSEPGITGGRLVSLVKALMLMSQLLLLDVLAMKIIVGNQSAAY